MRKNHAIIVGAGSSERTRAHKLWQEITPGYPLFLMSVSLFNTSQHIDSVLIVCEKEKTDAMKKLLNKYSLDKCSVIAGGHTRTESVKKAIGKLSHTAENDDSILIHNAANPLLTLDELEKGIKTSKQHDQVVFGYPAINTIKRYDQKTNQILDHLDRSRLIEVQTPQIFKWRTLIECFNTLDTKEIFTDDSALVASRGHDVYVYKSTYGNIKFTYDYDLLYEYRIGYGEDTHKVIKKSVKSKTLILGGAEIKSPYEITADSDGDIVAHALYNALSSAIGEKPLGAFADTECKNDNTDSTTYLSHILKNVENSGYEICNCVIHIEAKEPRLSDHHGKIQKSISEILRIEQDLVGLAYETGDDVSDISQNNGIRCKAHVLIRKPK